jgi:hypothetical protein
VTGDELASLPEGVALVTQGGLVAVLVWIARELGAIRQAVAGQLCRFREIRETRSADPPS